MALTPLVLTTEILRAGPGLEGPSFLEVAPKIGAAISTWATVPSNLVITGTTSGQLGGGTVLGTLQIPLDVSIMVGALTAAGVVGPTMSLLAQAVAVGTATAFNISAQYSGVSIGVGIGVDASKIISANPATLMSLLASSFLGPSGPLVASGLANGVSSLLLLGTGVGAVVGAGGTVTGVGTSLSSVS
jgi:hypothetical protein